MHARLPYRDDTNDGAEAAPAVPVDVAAAQARVTQADEAYRQAVYWMRTATASNRETRRRYLDRCTRAALEADVALQRAVRGQA